jgi:hypothetical protein
MGRAAGTILLWISFFIALMMLVTNSAWAPILLKQEGIGTREAALAMAAFNLGSVIATSFAGWLIARAGASIILPLVMIGIAVSVALVGYAAPSVGMVTLLQGLFGTFMGGGQLRSNCACRDLLSDRDPFDRRRLGDGHGPRRLVHRAAGRRLAGGAWLVDRQHFCRHWRAGIACRRNDRHCRPRQGGVSGAEARS